MRQDPVVENVSSNSSVMGGGAHNSKAGLYLRGKIFDVDVEFLVDTGSEVTLISPTVWQLLCSGRELELETSVQPVANADSSPLYVLGEVEVGVRFGDLTTNWNVVVAHISSPGILGIDFLSKYNCHLNMGRGASLVFGNDGVRIPLVEEFRRDSYRVALVKNVVVPANCEMITAGLVVGSSGSCKRDLGNMELVEPRPELREKNDILVGRTLVDPGRQIVPVRVANMTGNHYSYIKELT